MNCKCFNFSIKKSLENQLTFMSEYYDVTAISSDKKRSKKFDAKNKSKLSTLN